MNIDGSFANSSVVVQSGGALGGNGGTIANSVTIQNGGAMAFSLEDASETNLTMGILTLGSNVDLQLVLGYAALVGDTFQLLDATSSFSGEFATINGAAFGPDNTFNLTFGENSYAFELTYEANGVVLEVVPEPQTVGLLLIAVGAFVFGWRRRASQSRKSSCVV